MAKGWHGIKSGWHSYDSNEKQRNSEKATPEDRLKYMNAWSDMMINIWREKIERLHVIDTYRLHQQMSENVVGTPDFATIQHKFMQYGIYQDCGVGYGYKKSQKRNEFGPWLDFLDYSYREENRLDIPRKVGPAWGGGYTSGNPREPREWFSRPYFASVMVLKEQMAYMYSEEFCGLIVDAIQYNERVRGTSMRNRLWGSHWRNKNKYSY